MKVIGIIFLLFFLPNVLLAADQSHNNLINKGINFLKDSLKDPYSAKIRNTSVKYHDEFKTFIVCGEVNAKNSYGAYTGYKRFFAFTNGMSVGTLDSSEGHDMLWRDFCLK